MMRKKELIHHAKEGTRADALCEGLPTELTRYFPGPCEEHDLQSVPRTQRRQLYE